MQDARSNSPKSRYYTGPDRRIHQLRDINGNLAAVRHKEERGRRYGILAVLVRCSTREHLMTRAVHTPSMENPSRIKAWSEVKCTELGVC